MLLLSHARNINLLLTGCFFRPISTTVSPHSVIHHQLINKPWRSSTTRSMLCPTTTSDANWNATIKVTGFLNSQDAYNLDQDLFSAGFTLEQLMELAGLSVAEAVYKCMPLHQSINENNSSLRPIRTPHRILVVCGPVSKYIINDP